jgi:hypothetical protein
VNFERDIEGEVPVVRAMAEAVRHRGPDGAGEWASGAAVFAHRRLAALGGPAAGQPVVAEASDDESAALAMYNLALDFQERSQASEARLIDQFEESVARLSGTLGDLIIVDDDDERLSLTVNGFRAEVIPEDSEEEWRTLTGSDQLVEFYDPTDVFGDLADALAEAFPAVAPELPESSANGTEEAEGVAATAEGEAEAENEDDGGDDGEVAEDRPTA